MTQAKQTGTEWESRLARYLTDSLGTPVRRLAQHGARDIGDLDGIYLHAAEAKAHRTLAIPDWLRQAKREAVNKGEPFHVVLVKRPRVRTPDCWAVMDIDNFARLVKRLRDAEERNGH